jgi:hypothetical protein
MIDPAKLLGIVGLHPSVLVAPAQVQRYSGVASESRRLKR